MGATARDQGPILITVARGGYPGTSRVPARARKGKEVGVRDGRAVDLSTNR